MDPWLLLEHLGEESGRFSFLFFRHCRCCCCCCCSFSLSLVCFFSPVCCLFPFLFSFSYSMDTAHWPQFPGGGVVVKQMEAGGGGSSSSSSKGLLERKARPQKDQALNCPRCNSTNTKFCYYNNYSLSQPRYFCKSCRRYWTEGGSLRNVPVGGGSRKNKRSSLSSSSTSASSSAQDKKINGGSDQNPKIHHAQDLNLAIFPPNDQDYHHQTNANPPSSSASSSHLSALELLKSGMASRGLASFMAMPPAPPANGGGGGGGSIFNSSGFALHELKPSISFSLEGFENGYGDLHQGGQNQTAATNGHLMFPIEELKQVSNSNATAEFEQSRGGGGGHGGDSAGYWNGMLGGGSW